MSQEILFNKYNIFDVLQSRRESVKKRIQETPANKLLNASEHDLVQALVEEFRLDVPVLKEDKIHIADHGETQVDVRDPIMYTGSRPLPFQATG
ncbi:MAG: hypothetical protein WB586_28595 [Chthoniobacterales bacterium]